MAFIEGIKQQEFLNRLNWDVLSCHDKALCIMAESLKKNASLYFILFRLVGREYLHRQHDLCVGDSAYYQWIGQQCGISIVRKYESAANFQVWLKKAADQKKHCVLMINTKYQPGARLEGLKDHPHFMAYRGYDCDHFHFIDEDWSKEYWRTKDVEDIIYCDRAIDFDQLCVMSLYVKSCNIFTETDRDDIPEGNYFMYYELWKNNDAPLDLQSIKSEFCDQLSYLVENNMEQLTFAHSELNTFKRNLGQYREKMIVSVLNRLDNYEKQADRDAMNEQIICAKRDELFKIRTRFIYPCESEIIGAEYYFLYTIFRLLIVRSSDFRGKEKAREQIVILLKAFDYVKLNIARSIILGNEALVDKAWELYVSLNKKSLSVYKTLVREEWTIEEFL